MNLFLQRRSVTAGVDMHPQAPGHRVQWILITCMGLWLGAVICCGLCSPSAGASPVAAPTVTAISISRSLRVDLLLESKFDATDAISPSCMITNDTTLAGEDFYGEIINGTWNMSTRVNCGSQNLDDAALSLALYDCGEYAEVPCQSYKQVDSGLQGSNDFYFETLTTTCAACSGWWAGKVGQLLFAPTGYYWPSTPAGCQYVENNTVIGCFEGFGPQYISG